MLVAILKCAVMAKRRTKVENLSPSNAWHREWHAKNPHKYAEYMRRFRERYPEKAKANHRNYYLRHKERLAAQQKIWVAANREKVRAANRARRKKNPQKAHEHDLRHRLKKDYGITREQFDAMLVAQGNACAICRTPRAQIRRLCVDHCHKTKTVRGLLCQYCNVGLAQFRDNPAFLFAAIDYLARSIPIPITLADDGRFLLPPVPKTTYHDPAS